MNKIYLSTNKCTKANFLKWLKNKDTAIVGTVGVEYPGSPIDMFREEIGERGRPRWVRKVEEFFYSFAYDGTITGYAAYLRLIEKMPGLFNESMLQRKPKKSAKQRKAEQAALPAGYVIVDAGGYFLRYWVNEDLEWVREDGRCKRFGTEWEAKEYALKLAKSA